MLLLVFKAALVKKYISQGQTLRIPLVNLIQAAKAEHLIAINIH